MATVKDKRLKINDQKEEELPSNSRSIPEHARKTRKFPKLSRFITERHIQMNIALGLCIVIVLLGIYFVTIDLVKNIQNEQHVDQKRREIQTRIVQWKQIIYQHPDYRDGYFMLATLEYQIGDNTSAQKYNEKTLQLDPNFNKAKTLGKLLEIKTIGEK